MQNNLQSYSCNVNHFCRNYFQSLKTNLIVANILIVKNNVKSLTTLCRQRKLTTDKIPYIHLIQAWLSVYNQSNCYK